MTHRASKRNPVTSAESGQSTIEYILMIAFIASIFVLINQGFTKYGITDKIIGPIKRDYAATYQFGHPKAKGFDNGPEHHPRAAPGSGKENFRLFINPVEK